MTPNHEVVQLYGSLADQHSIVYPESDDAFTNVIRRLEQHREHGGSVAITDGAFDVPTENHVWALRECRRRAARIHFGAEFDSADQQSKLRLVASSSILLVATIDSDLKVRALKSRDESKGGAERPVYPWRMRATRVAGLTVPDGDGAFRQIVNLSLPEGRDVGPPALADHLTFGSHLIERGLLGSWIISADHPQAQHIQVIFPTVEIVPTRTYVTDPKTGALWSSSHIIRRIRDTPAELSR